MNNKEKKGIKSVTNCNQLQMQPEGSELSEKNRTVENAGARWQNASYRRCGQSEAIRSDFFTTKVHKGFSQRTQSVDKQHIVLVFLCVYFVLFVVKKTKFNQSINQNS